MNPTHVKIEITAETLTTEAKEEWEIQKDWYINPIERIPTIITDAIERHCERIWQVGRDNRYIWGTNCAILGDIYSSCDDEAKKLDKFTPELDIPTICQSLCKKLILDTHLEGDRVFIDSVEIVKRKEMI